MKKKIDLTTGSILQKLLIVAIPTLLTSIVQMSYNLTDMFWVGKVYTMGLDPEEAIAAVGIAGFYTWFGFGLILLVKIGTSVKVSQAAGRNDMEDIKRIGNNGIVFMLVLAAIYSVIGYFGADLYISIFNSDSINVVNYSTEYLKIMSMFVTSMFMVHLFNGVNDGLGKTINTFLITSSGLVLNIILDPLFILEEVNIFGMTLNGLGMGVRGAAIATVIAQSFILLIYIVLYSSKFRPFRIRLVKYFDWDKIKEIAKIGIPVGIQSMLFTTIAIIIGRMVTSYHEDYMAIQRLGSQIEALAWMIASGFQVALASFVGQNYGAGKMDRIKEGYITALKLLVPYGILVNVVMFVFAEQMIGIFLHDPNTIVIGKRYLEILSISQLFMIIELGTAGAFNGLGKTHIPSGVGFIGNIIRIPLGMLIAVSLGVYGIWWAVSISSIIKGTVLTVWFLLYLRKIKLLKASS
ncbi:MAG: Multidrug export protein MepA [Candidatus Izimaplasma bacterium HR2]|nr:MAG: Multidrug export protein MepA [Candidatus Izimaplasma bacterium HR2]